MTELQALMKLSQERIELLQELDRLVKSGHKLSLPDSHARALQQKMPLLADVAAVPERLPVAAPEDFLLSKAVISQEEAVNLIKFLPLRNPRSSSSSAAASQPTLPSALLVTAQADGTLRLFTPSGELVHTYAAGHEQPVMHLAVSPSHDEYLIATGDVAGVIRVHKVNVRQRRLSKDQKQARRNSTDEKLSQYLGSSVNATIQLQKQIQVPPGSDGEAARVTALALASQQGNKYYVAGDAEGKVSIFSKNGTLRAQVDATTVPGGPGIEGLYAHLSTLLFRAGLEWGYLDLEKLEVRHLDCPKLEGRVTAATIDSQMSTRVLVADEAGTVWAFNTKNRKECKVEMHFPKGVTRAPVDLASIRGYILGLESPQNPGEPGTLLALNMSYAPARRTENDAPSAIVWRQSRPAARAWSVHKRYQQGDLLAFLSEDGHEIEIVELLMQTYTAPVQDSFGNFKLPVIAVAIVLVLGYQYIKQKGRFGGKKFDFGSEDFGALKSKRRLAGPLAGLKDKKF